MSVFNYSVAVGEISNFPSGDFFMLEASSYPVKVEFLKNGSIYQKNDDVESGTSFKPSNGFDSVRVTSANAQALKIVILDGEATINRLSGVVTVRENSDLESLSGGAFQVGDSYQPSAGWFGGIQLFNPVGSGVVTLIDKVLMNSDSLGVQASLHLSANIIVGSNVTAVCVNPSKAKSKSVVNKKQNSASASFGDLLMFSRLGAAYEKNDFDFKNAIVLEEGYGLTLICQASYLVAGSFNFREQTA